MCCCLRRTGIAAGDARVRGLALGCAAQVEVVLQRFIPGLGAQQHQADVCGQTHCSLALALRAGAQSVLVRVCWLLGTWTPLSPLCFALMLLADPRAGSSPGRDHLALGAGHTWGLLPITNCPNCPWPQSCVLRMVSSPASGQRDPEHCSYPKP